MAAWVLALAVGISSAPAQDYKNPNLTVDERVKDFLGRMTLEEKVRQLDMYDGCKLLALDKKYLYDHNHARPDAPFVPENLEKTLHTLWLSPLHCHVRPAQRGSCLVSPNHH